jgi:uncharacterized OB-fold protein
MASRPVAEGRFALQVCLDCGVASPAARRLSPCPSPRLPFRDVDRGGTLLAETTVQTSTDPYFRERTPWRVGSVKLDVGPVVVAHLHRDGAEGIRGLTKLDKSGWRSRSYCRRRTPKIWLMIPSA